MFIVLEGGDGSGKGTQAELLRKTLEQSTVVTMFDFPRYDGSFFGALVGRALKGELGDFKGLSPYLASLPYMIIFVGGVWVWVVSVSGMRKPLGACAPRGFLYV